MDKKLQRQREEMDNKVQWERDEIDQKIARERVAVDLTIKQERGNMDHNLKQIHEEMCKKMQREREGIDKKVKQERAGMDRALKQMHEEMARKLQEERKDMDHILRVERTKIDSMNMQTRAEMDHNLRQQRMDMDYKVKLEQIRMEGKMMQNRLSIDTKDMDRDVQLKRAKMDFINMPPRTDMDQRSQVEHHVMDYKAKLDKIRKEAKMLQESAMIDRKAEHEQFNIPYSKKSLSYSPPDIDHGIQLKGAKMDFMNVEMDQKLQEVHEVMDYEAKLDKIRKEAKMMQDSAMTDTKDEHEQLHIPSSEQSLSDSPPVLVMEFRVFKDRRLYQVPKGYVERKPGLMIFNEPGKVDWSTMLDNLYDHRYRSCSDVYYIKPGCVPPKGMVLISGEEDVDQMMQVHEGLKKCDLYIVRNCEYSDSDDSEMYGGMSDDDEYPPLGYINIGDRVSDEYGSSPGIVRSPLNNREKALTFDNNDEHADSKN